MTVLEKWAAEETLCFAVASSNSATTFNVKPSGSVKPCHHCLSLSSSVRRPMHLSMAAGVSSSMTSSSSSPTGSTAGVQPVPPLPRQSVQEGDAMVRLAALERELAGVREESERRGEEVAKYKDRWQKLKESARKKKEAKMGVTDAGLLLMMLKRQYRQGGTSIVMSRGVDYHSDTSTSDTYNTTTITLEDDGLSAGAPIMSPALGSISTKSPPPSSSKRIPGSSASFSASTDASYPQGYTSLHTSRISPPVNDTRSDPSRSTFRIDSQDPTSLPSPNTTTAPSIPLPRHSVTSPPSLTAKSPKLARQNSSSSTRSAGGIRSDPRSRNPSAQDNWDLLLL
ncbi:hypothetical protein BC829DRAFT_83617 [Chytridium lagenaria]|nr:hypothetical protein BC829DRAFT_83617 [Chytridium lagenaria]